MKKSVKSVLIVDDDRVLRKLVSKKLKSYSDSLATFLAADGIEAQQLLKENNISLVITDLQMPRMDGYTLLADMSEKYPDIQVVILTAHGNPNSKKKVMETGAIGYIEKPFVVEELAGQILQMLKKEDEGGTLQTVSMEMFIQLIEMEQKSCTVRVLNRDTQKQGVLFFRNGDLMDARINDRKGIASADEILAWDNVTISIQDQCTIAEKKLRGNLKAILFDAIRIKDEVTSHPGTT